MEIIDILNYGLANKASDIHLTPDYYPCLRINGDITPIEQLGKLNSDTIKSLLYSIMTDSQRAEYERTLEIDFAVQFTRDMRYRVNAFTTSYGTAAVFRSIPIEVPSIERMGFPTIFKRLSMLKKGLILVTGPTGSGKSTTLAAMINEINRKSKKHILTIEDPIEFVHSPIGCIINQRELHRSTLSFKNALKSALREDPDIIMVGEMRDLETISLALTAAETGHLVMGTLHTTSAAKTIDRIIDVFPANEKELIRSMVASSIQGIISQALLKNKDETGRVAAFEVMVGTNAVRNLIRENKIPQLNSMISVGSRYGMISLQDSISKLLRTNKISEEVAKSALNTLSDEADEEEIIEEPQENKTEGKVSNEYDNRRSDYWSKKGFSKQNNNDDGF